MPDGSELAVAAAIEACAAGWDDSAARTRAAAELGFAIDDETARRLALQLSDANAARTRYTLPLPDLIRALVDAREAGVGLRHGGQGGKFARTSSTVALAVRDGEVVHVGLGTTVAHNPSPKRIWKTLVPWRQEVTKNLATAQRWARTEPTTITVPIVERAARDSRTSLVVRDAVLAEVLGRPHDDAPRLVYADALTARGDPRGELIIVQCALAAGSQAPSLVKRERELLREHGATWLRDTKQFARQAELRRGFVGSVTMTVPQFAKAGQLFEREPIEELVVASPTPKNLARLVAVPHFGRLDRVVIPSRLGISSPEDRHLLHTFLRSLTNLRSLYLHAVLERVDTSIFDELVWSRMEHLEVFLAGVGLWESLCRANMPNLRTLAIMPMLYTRALAASFPDAAITALRQR